MHKSILFDMDGLMFDTERAYAKEWINQAATFGIELSEDVLNGMRGVNKEQAGLVFVKKYHSAEIYDALCEKVYNEVEGLFANNVIHQPGLLELLEAAKSKGITMAVASSTRLSIVEQMLKTGKVFSYFSAIIGGDMITFSKPNPEIFLKAASALGTDIKECIVLEDSFNGVRAGFASGAFTIMVPDMDAPTEEIRQLASAVLPSLSEVIKFL